MPGEYSGGMWVQCLRHCSVKIAQPSSLWSGRRITLAIIIKGCVHHEKMRYVCFDICMLESNELVGTPHSLV